MKNLNIKYLLSLFLLVGVLFTGTSQTTTVNIFRDYDADGVDDGATEPGITGLTVTAYNAAGTATAFTGAAGAYTVTGLSGALRIEVTGAPAYLHPTTAQSFFVTGGATSAVGFQYPADYTQASPNIVTPCWVNGNPLIAGTAATSSVLVKVAYNSPANNSNVYLADGSEIGATYGVAYHRTAKMVFVSAVQRRHMGYGPMGTGGIYRIDASNNVVQFLDLNQAPISTGTNPHTGLPAGGTTPSYDAASYDAVGKLSLGDMDISEDEKTLWVMNLNEQTLLEVPLGGTSTNPTAPAIGSVVEHAWPTPCGANKFRAWGVEVHNGKVYIAGLCSEEETGGVSADLHVYIYEHDPAGAVGNFTLVYDFGGLNHTRGFAIDINSQSGAWLPWKSTWTTVTPGGGNGYVSFPQPMVTDLEFDKDGDMILGFSDRFGLQSGYRNYNISGTATTLYSGATAGDIYRVCYDGTNYALEGQTGCTQAYNTSTGFGGKEFYSDATDFSTSLNPTSNLKHAEATQGALAYNINTDGVVTNMTDPEGADSGGLLWLNTAGAQTDKYEVFDGTASNIGKAAGLGDIELLKDPATLEVGNFIWTDTDGDGIQDPGESGIAGLTVTLWKDDGTGNFSQISSTTTVTNGRYGFSNAATGTAGNGVAYNVTTLLPNMNYQIRVASGQAPISALSITGANTAASGSDASNNNKTDQRDSDADASGKIAFSTGGFGQNNYTLDIGYAPAAACGITVITVGTPGACNDNGTPSILTDDWFTASITVTFSNSPATGNLVLSGDVLAGGGAISVAVATAGAGPTYIFTGVRLKADGTASAVTAAFSADAPCTFSITNGPSVSACSVPPCNISAVSAVAGPCTPAASQYTVTGAVTFTQAPGSGTLTVQITGGGSQVFNAPFTSPANYSIAGQTSDGAAHTITATFSADNACFNTNTYNAPTACCPGPQSFCPTTGETFTLTAEAGLSSYQWYRDGTPVAGANSVTYTATSGGVYTYTALDGGGCPTGGCCPITLVETCSCITPSALTFTQLPPTCNVGGIAQNNGSITLTSVTNGTHFGVSTLNSGVYNGPSTVATATAISLPQVIKTNIPNTGGSYIVRIFNVLDGCFVDQTVTVVLVSCSVACIPPTASFVAVPGNCTGITINNNGRIVLTQATGSPDKYGVSTGASYTGPAFAAAIAIGALPLNVQSNVLNTGGTYTVRLFAGSNACYSDFTVVVPPTNCPSDPMGYLYCEETGRIITGGTITVSGPSPVVITENGISGQYQFFTDGTAGTYVITYAPPAGFMLSTTRLPAGILDPTGQPDPYVLGSNSAGGVFLDNSTAAANPYYLTITLAPGDPEILRNNIALKGCAPTVAIVDPCVCHDVEYDNVNDPLELLDYIDVTDGPGKTWQITAQTGLETVDPLTNIPLVVPAALTYNVALGVYRIYVAHTSGVGYTATLSNGTFTLNISNLCTKNLPVYPALPAPYCTNAAATALSASQPNFTATYFIGSLGGAQITSFNPALYVGQSSVDVLIRYLPTNANDCPLTIRTPVPLSNPPVLATLPGTVCAGESLDLNSLVTGNSPVGALSFHLTQANANAGLNALVNTTVAPSVTTTYYVRSLSNVGCAGTASAPITVSNPPVLVVTNGMLCSNGSIDLATLVTSAGGGTLSYYATAANAQAGVNALASSTVTPASATNYYVRSAVTTNGVTCFSVEEITISLAPVVCSGTGVTGPN